MKNIVLLLVFFIAVTSCKNNSKSEKKDSMSVQDEKTAKQSDGLVLMKGEFVYFDGAAVLQANSSSIYGVVINEKMHELDKMAQQFKTDPTDYVSVEIRGKIIPKPDNEEGWPYRVDIKEILKVSKSQTENEVIKLESE
ncbi:MAG TPA: hypothetical protein VJ945_03815 [Flavobacteriaceae bacterium]|nr:hypothetical protein [Flavobacteriaceae bacterium]